MDATAKNCAVSPTATTSWSNTTSPTDWCPATNTTVTTPTAKCSKAATTSAKNGRSTTAKTIPSLPTHWGGRRYTVSTKTGNLDDVNIARESVFCNLSAGSSGYVKERPEHNGETTKTPNREHCRTIHV